MLEHVHWLGHDSFRIDGSSIVYIDPWKLPPGQPDADVVLITHDHYDHFSPSDIEKVAGPGAIVVGPPCVTDQLRGHVASAIEPRQTITAATATVTAIPAYNIDKFKSAGVVYHPRSAGHVGYIVDMDGLRIYHAGDTDAIPEMDGIEVDIALLPVGGTYTCTADEAAKACARLKAKVVVPMHFGDIVGTEADAQRLERLCAIPFTILSPERE